MILIIFLVIGIATACPTNEDFLRVCYCQSNTQSAGIQLECSGSNITQTLGILKLNRPQLGLIQELLIRNSSAFRLSNGMFQQLFIKTLDLSFNQIDTIEPDSFNGLQNVLTVLILKGNQLRAVPTAALRGLNSLKQVDLSQNDIGNLGSTILYNTPKLIDLNLSGNRICRIDRESFKHVKQNLQSLSLADNCMESVPASAVRGFQQLLALSLNGNQITRLEPLQFMNLPVLNLINLAHNKINSIHRQAFLNVPKLKFMYISDNVIQNIEPNQFSHFEELELMDLSRNTLTSIGTAAFSSMSRLSQLYLVSNNISTIEPHAFSNSSIVILLLAQNNLDRLNGDMFYGLNQLQQLSLKQNKISAIAQNAFYQLPSLVVLDLSHNNISTLQPATFLAQLNLFVLDLGHNQLSTVPYNALNQRINTVMLQENPLVCVERVHVLQQGQGLYVPTTVDHICGGVDPVVTPVNAVGVDTVTSSPSFIIDTTVQIPVKQTTVRQHGVDNGFPFSGFNPNIDRRVSTTTTRPDRPRVITFPTIGDRGILPGQPNRGPQPQPQPLPVTIRPNGNNNNGWPRFGPNGERLPATENTFPFVPRQPPINPAIIPSGIPNDPRPQWPVQATTPPRQSQSVAPSVNSENPAVFTFELPTPIQPKVEFITHFPQTPPTYPQRPTQNRRPAIEEITRFPQPNNRFSQNSQNPLFPNGNIGQPALTTFPPFPPQFPVTNPVIVPQFGSSSTERQTLPPEIVFAPPHDKFNTIDPNDINRTPLSPKKLPSPGEPDARGSDSGIETTTKDPKDKKEKSFSASTTIAVCLSVVIAVILIVFITLCVVRHRVQTKRSESASSRTSAYVAAQSARVNFPGSAVNTTSTVGTYGSGKYHHETLPKPPSKHGSGQHTPNMAPAGNTWIYAPAGFTPSGNYYK